MYARYFTFKGKPGTRSEIEVLADDAFGLMTSLQGFISVHFLILEAEDQYGSFSLWESEADAQAAGQAIRAKTSGSLDTLAVEMSAPQLFEVYKPKS